MVIYKYSDVKEAKKPGTEGTDLNFEFKMASYDNVVFIDHRIMDFAFLISLTHKTFFIRVKAGWCRIALVCAFVRFHPFINRFLFSPKWLCVSRKQ